MDKIKIEFTIEDLNSVLDTLAEKPYKSVFKLINSIQSEANKQIQANNNANPKK